MGTKKTAEAPAEGGKATTSKAAKKTAAKKAAAPKKDIPNEVNILNSAGDLVRTYTRKEHGDGLLEMAEEYARKTGKRVQVAE